MQYNRVQYSTVQYNTVQYITIQYSTVQYNTIQYSTVQYNTIQYSTARFYFMFCPLLKNVNMTLPALCVTFQRCFTRRPLYFTSRHLRRQTTATLPAADSNTVAVYLRVTMRTVLAMRSIYLYLQSSDYCASGQAIPEQ